MSRTYRIGEAAAITGLSRDTLRFYEKKGLIRSRRLENGYRIYTEEKLSALVSILPLSQEDELQPKGY